MPLFSASRAHLLALALFAGVLPAAHAAEDEATFLKESVAFFDQQTREHLPMQVDAQTRLDSIRLDPQGKELIYSYSLTQQAAADMDSAARGRFESDMRGKLETGSCSQPQLLDTLRQHGIRIEHRYSGKDSQPLADIHIDPQALTCKG
ncbi:MAG: hypothetical protein GAK43_01139 [Stenotrophomonas maltophilia]|nr:MAG: hypothetical protein GAK43_01139 [Stenotrophomonas maltophilia]